jgi:hypothetical protein
MAKFYGKVGYGQSLDAGAGVYADAIIEKQYYGDVVRDTRQIVEGDDLNPDLNVQNSISIIADAYAEEHFIAIRYVEWAGVLWTVSSVDVERPRLLLRLGGVYNGPTA